MFALCINCSIGSSKLIEIQLKSTSKKLFLGLKDLKPEGQVSVKLSGVCTLAAVVEHSAKLRHLPAS